MKCEVDSMLFVLSLPGVGTCDPAVIKMDELLWIHSGVIRV